MTKRSKGHGHGVIREVGLWMQPVATSLGPRAKGGPGIQDGPQRTVLSTTRNQCNAEQSNHFLFPIDDLIYAALIGPTVIE